jgi:hypothetical protein
MVRIVFPGFLVICKSSFSSGYKITVLAALLKEAVERVEKELKR